MILGCREIGLELNAGKCELFVSGKVTDASEIHARFKTIAPEIKLMTSADLSPLGAPMFEDGIISKVTEKQSELITMIDKLQALPAHQALFLLKNCLAIPKLTYILRCSPTFKCHESLLSIDDTLRRGLEKVTNIKMDSLAWIQASLPVKHGGLGIRRTSSIALPA